ncbi:MAG: hypothetical protein RR140_04140 [Clostridia bacterium]
MKEKEKESTWPGEKVLREMTGNGHQSERKADEKGNDFRDAKRKVKIT